MGWAHRDTQNQQPTDSHNLCANTKLKNRRPLADEIRDYLKNKGVEEKLIDKMVETALGMGWQDLDEDELQKKLDSFILIYGE